MANLDQELQKFKTSVLGEEIRDALVNSVTLMNNDLSVKADKTQVLTDVPAGAVFTDTVTTINGKTGTIEKADITALGIPAQDTTYTHPSTHPASIITESAIKRFVTDTERGQWNGKTKIVTSATEPSLETGDQWHKEI